jgi:hypothetical protein
MASWCEPLDGKMPAYLKKIKIMRKLGNTKTSKNEI